LSILLLLRRLLLLLLLQLLCPLPLCCQVGLECCLQGCCVLALRLCLPEQVLVALVQLPLPVTCARHSTAQRSAAHGRARHPVDSKHYIQ
jgi:hypothetical protein